MKSKIIIFMLLLASISFASNATNNLNVSGLGEEVTTTYNFTPDTQNTTKIYNFHLYVPLIDSSLSSSQVISTNETNKTYSVDLLFDIPHDISPQTINGQFEIENDGDVQKENVTVNVLEDKRFNVSSDKNFTIYNGEEKRLNFTIDNKGNTVLKDEVTLSTGNNTLLRQNVSVPKYSSKNVYFDLEAPMNETGTEKYEWYFKNKTALYNIKTKDNISPEAEVKDLKDNYDLAKDYTFYVKATDNKKVKDVKLNICNETFDTTRQGEMWESDFSFDVGGVCRYDVEVIDSSNNTANLNGSMTFEYFKNLSIPEVMDIEKTKVDSERTTELFKLVKEVEADVKVKKLEFKEKGASNKSSKPEEIVDVVLKTRDFEKILTSESTTNVDLFREVDLVTEANKEGTVSFVLEFEFPETFLSDPVKTVDVEQEFGEYSVPDSWSGDIFGVDAKCTPYDEGSFKESYYECILEYPIDTTHEDMSVPCTQELKESQEKNFNSRIEEKESTISMMQLNRDMLLFLLFNTLAVVFYVTTIHPRGRFKLR